MTEGIQERLVVALEDLLEARGDLALAKSEVPSYTGQHSEEYFYEDAQKRYEKVRKVFYETLREACK